MRARYSAYALGLVDYIIRSTYPGGPQWRPDVAAWRSSLVAYCEETEFRGLQVLPSEAGKALAEERAEVSFRANLRHGSQDRVLAERSEFLFAGGEWLYYSGEAL